MCYFSLQRQDAASGSGLRGGRAQVADRALIRHSAGYGTIPVHG